MAAAAAAAARRTERPNSTDRATTDPARLFPVLAFDIVFAFSLGRLTVNQCRSKFDFNASDSRFYSRYITGTGSHRRSFFSKIETVHLVWHPFQQMALARKFKLGREGSSSSKRAARGEWPDLSFKDSLCRSSTRDRAGPPPAPSSSPATVQKLFCKV